MTEGKVANRASARRHPRRLLTSATGRAQQNTNLCLKGTYHKVTCATITKCPDLAILGTAVVARSMAHALIQARLQHGSSDKKWQCLAPQSEDSLADKAVLYLLGMDWHSEDRGTTSQHQFWRQRLHAEARDYVVLYGNTQQQWQQLAQSLRSLAPAADWSWLPASPAQRSARLRPYGCEQCSDPDCERRLFDALRSGRD